jgi:hypothetical protein
MNIFHRLTPTAIGLSVAVPGVAAQDLALYRNVQLGMNIAAAAARVAEDKTRLTNTSAFRP